ncbi:hypothetical protein [Microbacterium sp. F2]
MSTEDTKTSLVGSVALLSIAVVNLVRNRPVERSARVIAVL